MSSTELRVIRTLFDRKVWSVRTRHGSEGVMRFMPEGIGEWWIRSAGLPRSGS